MNEQRQFCYVISVRGANMKYEIFNLPHCRSPRFNQSLCYSVDYCSNTLDYLTNDDS